MAEVASIKSELDVHKDPISALSKNLLRSKHRQSRSQPIPHGVPHGLGEKTEAASGIDVPPAAETLPSEACGMPDHREQRRIDARAARPSAKMREVLC